MYEETLYNGSSWVEISNEDVDEWDKSKSQ